MSGPDGWRTKPLATIQVVRLIRQCSLASNVRAVLESFVVYGAGTHRIAPAIATVAYDADVSERTAQRMKKVLVKAGVLKIIGYKKGGLAAGGLRGHATEYALNLNKLPGPRPVKGDSKVSPFEPTIVGVASTMKGDKQTAVPRQNGHRRVTAMVSPDRRDRIDRSTSRRGRIVGQHDKYAEMKNRRRRR